MKTTLEMFKEIEDLDMPDGVGITVKDIVPFMCEKIEQALQRLEQIDNAKPSEALECLENIWCDISTNYVNEYVTIKQALIKAEKEHNSTNLLMQELDCKDFETLRKYARCGYERLNNFKGSKKVKIKIPESSLMDYNPVKKYLKWEDLDFKEERQTIKVRMGNTIYNLFFYKFNYSSYKRCHLCNEEETLIYDIQEQLFNDLHLERVEE